MMTNSTILTCLGLLATASAAILHAGNGFTIRDALPNGFVETEITWSGFEEVGVDTVLTGPLETVLAQLPETEEALKRAVDNMTDARVSELLDIEHRIAAGEPDCPPCGPLKIDCDPNNKGVGPARVDGLIEGMRYLLAMDEGKMCGNAPGHDGVGSCGRISCSKNSGIWWCNDNKVEIMYPCRNFATFVHYLAVKRDTACFVQDFQGYNNFAQGQLFDLTANVNVIVAAPEGGC